MIECENSCEVCGSTERLLHPNGENWVCEDHIDALQDGINKENDKKESKEAFRLLKIACKGFKATFDTFVYHSENDLVADKFSILEGLLEEFENEAERFERNISKYY